MSSAQVDWRTLRSADGDILLARVRWCTDHWCKFRGLMLRASLPPDEGLLFVYERESKMDTSIHMFFMRIPIAVIWMDAEMRIVDKVLAKPWRPIYAPAKPAQYVLEAPPALLERVMIGERVTFEPGGG